MFFFIKQKKNYALPCTNPSQEVLLIYFFLFFFSKNSYVPVNMHSSQQFILTVLQELFKRKCACLLGYCTKSTDVISSMLHSMLLHYNIVKYMFWCCMYCILLLRCLLSKDKLKSTKNWMFVRFPLKILIPILIHH